ncbi:MAG: adenosine deaminase [Gemmatimonadaceae bacterium]
MTAIDRDLLRRLPKAELHCHLDGSVRPQTLLDLAREYGVTMPRTDASGLGEHMTVRDAHNLEEYLARFTVTLSVMQHAAALERIAYELGADAHKDGVWYLETRFAPVLNIRAGLTTDEVIDAVVRGLARAEAEFGIVARVIVTALRDLDPSISLEMARLAVDYRGRGVVGFDLAGGEAGHPASHHAAAFDYARSHDLACTCHAGEGDGAQSVREAVQDCCVHRVGHGTRLFEDPALMDYVNDRRIPIEICVTSNIQTRAARSYATHPVRRYFDAGLNVVLNTDNRLMSATTLTDEYSHAATHLGFTLAELGKIAVNGFESAFMPFKEREGFAARARKAIDGLVAEARA